MKDQSEGDLMASGEQAETGVSESAGDTAVADESEFDKVEEERNEKEAEVKKDEATNGDSEEK